LFAIQSTIYYALKNIRFDFIEVYRCGNLVVSGNVLFHGSASYKEILELVASSDADWLVQAFVGEKILICKYYSSNKSYLVSVLPKDPCKQTESYFVKCLKNGWKLERYECASLVGENVCRVVAANFVIKNLLYREFGVFDKK
jgi:hypothetical protein